MIIKEHHVADRIGTEVVCMDGMEAVRPSWKRNKVSWRSWVQDLSYGGDIFPEVESAFQGLHEVDFATLQAQKASRRRHWQLQ